MARLMAVPELPGYKPSNIQTNPSMYQPRNPPPPYKSATHFNLQDLVKNSKKCRKCKKIIPSSDEFEFCEKCKKEIEEKLFGFKNVKRSTKQSTKRSTKRSTKNDQLNDQLNDQPNDQPNDQLNDQLNDQIVHEKYKVFI